jgi:hypothetical protein
LALLADILFVVVFCTVGRRSHAEGAPRRGSPKPGDHCNIIDGLCHGQFDDGPSSVSTGLWVCKEVEQGRSRDSIVYDLSRAME